MSLMMLFITKIYFNNKILANTIIFLNNIFLNKKYDNIIYKMVNYLYTNNYLIYDKIILIKKLSEKQINKYKYNDIIFSDEDIDNLHYHNKINIELYKKICLITIPKFNVNFNLLDMNGLNILDGIYEQGSNKIYNNKYTEHVGYITTNNNIFDKFIIINEYNNINKFQILYPKNTKDLLKHNYIFHTHPKTPLIGSRLNEGIIFEFPSTNDILHFIDFFNFGKLLCSLIISPEGLYVIHKYNFNTNHIKINYDIFINEIEEIINECNDYAFIEYEKYVKLDEFIIFYNKIILDFKYIDKINSHLMKYDLFIEYYPRNNLNNLKWLFYDIYLPLINKI